MANGDGLPTEAWLFCAGRWHEANTAEIAHNAGVMTAEQFLARFGHVPPLLLPAPCP